MVVKPPRLHFLFAAVLPALLFTSLSFGAASKQAATKKAAPKATAKAGARASTGKSAVAKSGTKRRRAVVARRPMTQQQPEAQRIREIQQALTEKGYPVEVSGVWGAESVEALKKFQAAQNINNLTGRGKLDSLTLISLGLGPRRQPAEAAGPTDPTEGKTP